MWLYTDQGHISVVADRDNDKKVFVRSRNKLSLVAFMAVSYTHLRAHETR